MLLSHIDFTSIYLVQQKILENKFHELFSLARL